MRIRILGSSFLLMLAIAASAHAQSGVNLAWFDCAGGGGYGHAVFTCANNSGSNTLVASFVPPSGITALGRATVTLRLCPDFTPTLPSWWQLFTAGSCRQSSLSWTAPVDGNCLSPWESAPVSGSVLSGPGATSTDWKIVADAGAADGSGHALDPSAEYEAARLVIDHASSTGAGACTGCSAGMWLVLEDVTLEMTDGSAPVHMSVPLVRQYVGWNSTTFPYPPCLNYRDPVRNRTWGAIKSMYR